MHERSTDFDAGCGNASLFRIECRLFVDSMTQRLRSDSHRMTRFRHSTASAAGSSKNNALPWTAAARCSFPPQQPAAENERSQCSRLAPVRRGLASDPWRRILRSILRSHSNNAVGTIWFILGTTTCTLQGSSRRSEMATLVSIEVPQCPWQIAPGSRRTAAFYESKIVVPNSLVKAESHADACRKSLLAIFAILIAVITVITLWIRQAREVRGAVVRHSITDCVRLVLHPEAIAGTSKQVAETAWPKFIGCTALILCQWGCSRAIPVRVFVERQWEMIEAIPGGPWCTKVWHSSNLTETIERARRKSRIACSYGGILGQRIGRTRMLGRGRTFSLGKSGVLSHGCGVYRQNCYDVDAERC